MGIMYQHMGCYCRCGDDGGCGDGDGGCGGCGGGCGDGGCGGGCGDGGCNSLYTD